MKLIGLVALMGVGSCLSAAVFTNIDIPGTTNIFSAGGGALSGGTAAVGVSFAAGAGQQLTFSPVTGTTTFCTGCGIAAVGADGGGLPVGWTGTNIDGASDGLSGVTFIGRQMFLVGVFLTAAAPGTGSVANLQSYTDASALTSPFNPIIGQVFFIGDGQGTAGAQQFFVPDTATRLFLGFADGTPLFGAAGAAGTPGAYADNAGSLQATFNIGGVPEPGTLGLLALGLVGLALGKKRFA